MFWVLCAIALVSGTLGALCYRLSADHPRYRPDAWACLIVFVVALVGMTLDLTFGWTP